MRYDITGQLVEEGESEGEDIIREDLRHVYRYDAEGRLIEKTMYHYGLYIERKKLAYNDQGDVVEEWHQHAGALPKHEKEWKTQSRYQYDDHGNWIERVAETALQTGDRQLSMIERRRIDYY